MKEVRSLIGMLLVGFACVTLFAGYGFSAGPALTFSPRKVEIAINTSFYVDVVAEEVNDLMGAYLGFRSIRRLNW